MMAAKVISELCQRMQIVNVIVLLLEGVFSKLRQLFVQVRRALVGLVISFQRPP